jgi:preprotein translocase subunit SecG
MNNKATAITAGLFLFVCLTIKDCSHQNKMDVQQKKLDSLQQQIDSLNGKYKTY